MVLKVDTDLEINLVPLSENSGYKLHCPDLRPDTHSKRISRAVRRGKITGISLEDVTRHGIRHTALHHSMHSNSVHSCIHYTAIKWITLL